MYRSYICLARQELSETIKSRLLHLYSDDALELQLAQGSLLQIVLSVLMCVCVCVFAVMICDQLRRGCSCVGMAWR